MFDFMFDFIGLISVDEFMFDFMFDSKSAPHLSPGVPGICGFRGSLVVYICSHFPRVGRDFARVPPLPGMERAIKVHGEVVNVKATCVRWRVDCWHNGSLANERRASPYVQ